MRVLYPGRIGIWRCWYFVQGGKTEDPEKHPPSKTRQATNSAHIRHRARSNQCGWRALSPLRYPCSPPMNVRLFLDMRQQNSLKKLFFVKKNRMFKSKSKSVSVLSALWCFRNKWNHYGTVLKRFKRKKIVFLPEMGATSIHSPPVVSTCSPPTSSCINNVNTP